MSAYLDRARSLVGVASEPWVARLPVNEAMIRHWCDALGDTLPVYTDPSAAAESVHGGVVAPPAMLNVWTMRGFEPFPAGDPQKAVTDILEEAGYPGVIATNYEQTYPRYLRPGETITAVRHIGAVSDEKRTGLGIGHFVDIVTTFRDDAGALVGTQTMRILKYRPAVRASAARPKPAINDDTQFFWDACARGELLIQRCAPCGVLRHPPRPGCGACGSLEWDTVMSRGHGEVYSYVVHHHPPVPGFTIPYVVALVALDEGTRIVANLEGVAPDDVKIGMRVEVTFVKVDERLTIPAFRPAGDA
jgi:uncharacterized OB-fold protein/acyl dehydratase